MNTRRSELEVNFPSTQSHALQSRAYLEAGPIRKEHRKEELDLQTVHFMDNVAYLLWLAKQGAVSLSALLMIGGALTALCLAVPAQGQEMLKVHTSDSTASNDNSRVIALMNKGLDDSIIVAKIKSSNWTFQLSDDDLVALRKNGVSAPVVAAMVVSNTPDVARVYVDHQAVPLDTMGQARTGGQFLNNMTGDLTALHENAFLVGPVSNISVSPMPEIVITLPKGDTISSYILVKMTQKSDRRELNVGSTGGVGNGRTGIRCDNVVKSIHIIESGDNTYQLQLQTPLKPGQYMIYVIGSSDVRKNIYGRGYDFAVLR